MILFSNVALVVLFALVIDAIIGDPPSLWRRVPHPVVWIGRVIAWMEAQGNVPTHPEADRRSAGVFAVIGLVLGAFVIGVTIEGILRLLPLAELWLGLVGAVLIAHKSLYDHVKAVRDALRHDLDVARSAVGMIVGRDTAELEEGGVARAAIESAGESFCDAIAAPVFWFLLLGLPGLLIYKAVNTADSMIGHKDERYGAYGFAAARLDDAMNYVPARLSALMIAVAGLFALASPINRTLGVVRADARKHDSPNSGYSEAAFAGVLDVALGGPRAYQGTTIDLPWFNAAARRALTHEDVSNALKLLNASTLTLAIGVSAIALVQFAT